MSRARTARPRAAHLGPELRRPLVLDAALGLFARDGYEAVSMQQIAEAAAVSKPVVYSCFPSKEELFAELLRREDHRLWQLVEGAVPAGDPADSDLHAELAAVFTALLRAALATPDVFRVLVLQASGEDRLGLGRVQWAERLTQLLAVRTSLPAREVKLMGRLLVATAEIGLTTLLEDPDAWEPAELADFLAGTLDRSVAHSR